ncbi:Uncharacterised protein [uncultured Blautia sp.]|jgi:hypothetical protein|nr:Uncharacterised protein [uncultured Blautia sp.]
MERDLKETFGLPANAVLMRLNDSLNLQNLLSFLMFTTPFL